jgi:hypothetical protein
VTRITHEYQHNFTENSLKFATYFVGNDPVSSGKWFPTYRRNEDHFQGPRLDKAKRMHGTPYIRLLAAILSNSVLSQTFLGLLDPSFVLNVANYSLSHPRRLASSEHLLQYSPHTPTVDPDQHSIDTNNKYKTRIQRGLNYTPSGQRNV